MGHRGGGCWLLLLGLPLSGIAQEQNPSDPARLMQLLLTRIEQLENRVAELEKSGAAEPREGSARAGHPPAGVNRPPETPAAPVAEPAAPQSLSSQILAETKHTFPALRFAGFSDMNFSATDELGSHSGFREGQFTLHLASPLSHRVSYFGEITLTARSTGFNAEIERSIIRFDHSDHLRLSFGRYHTPINYWNNTFHHGQWLQTSVSRPEMTAFGGQFIPVHFVGGMAEGSFSASGLNLNYGAGLGNGRGSAISRGGDAGDVNNNRAWFVSSFVKPDLLYGLQAGGSLYRDKITLGDGREFREWITSGHVVWQREDPEIIAEFSNVQHSRVGGSLTSNSQAFYLQMGYRLPWLQRLWKPYYRVEYIHVPRSDVVFQLLPKLSGSIFGLRYDISDFAALKFEYQAQSRRDGTPRVNGVYLQTSFTF